MRYSFLYLKIVKINFHGVPFVHSDQQNTWVLKVKAVISGFFWFGSGHMHIKDSKKTSFTFFYRFENQICLISWSINVADGASTNVTSTVLINSDDKKVIYKMDCFILHTILLVIILLLIISIICYHYKKIGQNKNVLVHWQYKNRE